MSWSSQPQNSGELGSNPSYSLKSRRSACRGMHCKRGCSEGPWRVHHCWSGMALRKLVHSNLMSNPQKNGWGTQGLNPDSKNNMPAICPHVLQETTEESDLLVKVPAREGPSPFMAHKCLCRGRGKCLDPNKRATLPDVNSCSWQNWEEPG